MAVISLFHRPTTFLTAFCEVVVEHSEAQRWPTPNVLRGLHHGKNLFMETDVPLSAIETDPFERILTRLQPSDDEYAVLDAKTDELKRLLRQALGPDYIVRDFGSYHRGTQLAKAVDPQRDVDLLIYMKPDAKHSRYSLSEEELRERFSRLTVATEPPAEPAFSEAESPNFREDLISESEDFREVRIAIQPALEQSGCRLTVHDPFMTVEKEGDIFDGSVAKFGWPPENGLNPNGADHV